MNRGSARALALCASLWLLSACGESDADRIDRFVESVTGQLDQARAEQAIATYVDLTQQPLDVGALGESRLYRAEDQARLDADAARRLPRVYGKNLRVLRRQVKIENGTARVELQLLGDGLSNVRFELHKRGERWLLGALRVQ